MHDYRRLESRRRFHHYHTILYLNSEFLSDDCSTLLTHNEGGGVRVLEEQVDVQYQSRVEQQASINVRRQRYQDRWTCLKSHSQREKTRKKSCLKAEWGRTADFEALYPVNVELRVDDTALGSRLHRACTELRRAGCRSVC